MNLLVNLQGLNRARLRQTNPLKGNGLLSLEAEFQFTKIQSKKGRLARAKALIDWNESLN
ncbi:MAG: hypothetical protein AAF197_10155 [Pseudomonadota bacterium]